MYNQVGVIPTYKFFVPNFSTLKLVPRSVNFVASKVFTFTFYCSIPRQAHVGKILRPADQAEDVAVVCSVIIWDRGHCGPIYGPYPFSVTLEIW